MDVIDLTQEDSLDEDDEYIDVTGVSSMDSEHVQIKVEKSYSESDHEIEELLSIGRFLIIFIFLYILYRIR